jgi:hypothetical protein
MPRHHNISTGGLYTGGAVVLPFHQPPNYARQLMMHQQAKNQALGQYYSKLENNINPVGVRDQDMDGWQAKLQAWQQFGIQNRNQLINPNADGGKAVRQFGAMHQDLLGDIQKSKAAAANERAIQPMMLDPKRRALTTNQDLLNAHKMGLSIYDPKHYKDDGVTPVSPADFSFNAPPYDEKKQQSTLMEVTKGLKLEKTYGKGKVNTAELKDYIPYTLKHSQANLKVIADRMGSIYDGDPSVQSAYDNKQLDQPTHDKLNAAYKSVYGQDQDIGTDPRKIAQADMINQNSQATQGTDVKGWSRPPVGKSLTKAQIDEQNMLNWTNGMASAMKTGDINTVKRLGDQLYSGNGKSTYQGIDQAPIGVGNTGGDISGLKNLHQGFIISHTDKQWVPDDPSNPAVGSYKDVLNKDEIDPTDPALVYKIGKIYQNHMGSTPQLEKALLAQTNSGQKPPPTTNPAPAQPPAPAANTKDPLGILQP